MSSKSSKSVKSAKKAKSTKSTKITKITKNDCKRIAEQITKAIHGEAWHGPSWQDNLDGVTLDAALRRPIEGGHSIAEVTLHMTTWNDVVRRRLEGETPNVTGALDWPKATLKDEKAWQTVVGKLFTSGDELATVVAEFPVAKLHRKRPNVEGTWYDLILGELQHILYHAGQVGLLKKASG